MLLPPEEISLNIDKRQIDSQPLRLLGMHKLKVRLTMDIIPECTVVVYREGESPENYMVDAEELAGLAGAGLLSGQNQLTGIRANLGFAESRIDQSIARIEAGVASLSIARRDLVSVDPFETATELENVQFQLESIYTLTARTSRLTLLNFLS